MLIGVLGATTAWATPPRFIADDPTDAALARKAWAAGEVCTGWVAPAHADVELHRTEAMDGYDGRAFVDGAGLYRIEIAGRNARRSLVHELAHAWASRGPAALTEGRTDLLADCIAGQLPVPGLLDPDPGRDLDALPDLRRWTNPKGRHDSAHLDADRADAYLGAARLMRVASTVVDPRTLWPTDGILRWRTLEGKLLAAGPRGAMVVDVLAGGAERQRYALTDRDRDGVPWLAEILQGTRPDVWDSDGDGWWDGASGAPVGAVPLPADGTAVCSGLAASANGARVQVLYRATRADTTPKVRVVAGDIWLIDDPARGVAVEGGKPVLLALDGGLRNATGGAWALAGGQGLSSSWNCRSTPRYTVWLADPLMAVDFAEFEAAVDEHLHRATGLLGPQPRRMVVELGADSMGVSHEGVHISAGLVGWARTEGRLDALAGLAVALHRTWQGPLEARRWDTAEALTRALVDDPPETLFVAVDEEHPAARSDDAVSCPEGWRGVVGGRCAPAAP